MNPLLTSKFDVNSYPQQCSALRKNGFVMLKNRPCKIMEMSTSKTGKHGHAKV
jgi:translation initiation factor 5A